MKKIFQYSFAALVGLVLASCTGDYTDWASPQMNPAENAAEKYGVTIVAGADANIVMPVRNDNVKLVALNAASDKVADFAVTSLTVNGEAIDASVENGSIVVSAAKLNELVQNQFNSRASVARTLDVESTVSLILTNGDAVTADVKGTTTASFTAKPTPAIDDKGYYILGNFEGNGWDLATPIWMEKVGDGVYSTIVTLSGDGDAWYKFYEGSHYENGNWDEVNKGEMGCAVNGDNAMENFIVFKGDDQAVQTPVISGDKGNVYKITLDMKNLTYKVVRQAVNYYIVGGPNDWAGSCASKELKFGQADIDVPVYTIVFPAAAEGDTWFAIGDDKACDAIVNDNNDAAWKMLFGTTNGNGLSGASGTLTRRSNLSDDGSFKVEAGAKFIQVIINMKEMTYEIKTMNFSQYIYEAGVNNDWGAIEQPLYSANMDGNYTGFFYAQDADWSGGKGAFKFQGAFNTWDQGNYGTGTMNDDGLTGTLINDGGSGNVMVEPGFYQAEVNLANMTFTMTRINSIGIIGPAQAGSWDTDTDMQYNPETRAWEATVELAADEFKFRANDDWGINWGGSFNNLTQDGPNLKISEAGTYFIQFFPLCETKSNCIITKK